MSDSDEDNRTSTPASFFQTGWGTTQKIVYRKSRKESGEAGATWAVVDTCDSTSGRGASITLSEVEGPAIGRVRREPGGRADGPDSKRLRSTAQEPLFGKAVPLLGRKENESPTLSLGSECVAMEEAANVFVSPLPFLEAVEAQGVRWGETGEPQFSDQRRDSVGGDGGDCAFRKEGTRVEVEIAAQSRDERERKPDILTSNVSFAVEPSVARDHMQEKQEVQQGNVSISFEHEQLSAQSQKSFANDAVSATPNLYVSKGNSKAYTGKAFSPWDESEAGVEKRGVAGGSPEEPDICESNRPPQHHSASPEEAHFMVREPGVALDIGSTGTQFGCLIPGGVEESQGHDENDILSRLPDTASTTRCAVSSASACFTESSLCGFTEDFWALSDAGPYGAQEYRAPCQRERKVLGLEKTTCGETSADLQAYYTALEQERVVASELGGPRSGNDVFHTSPTTTSCEQPPILTPATGGSNSPDLTPFFSSTPGTGTVALTAAALEPSGDRCALCMLQRPQSGSGGGSSAFDGKCDATSTVYQHHHHHSEHQHQHHDASGLLSVALRQTSSVYRLPRSPTARAAIVHYPYPPVPVQYLPPLKHSHQQILFDEFVKIEADPLRLQLGHFIVEHCTRSIPEEYLRPDLAPDPCIIADFVDQIIIAVEIFGEQTQYGNARDAIPTDINEVYISKWLVQKKHLLKPLELLHRRRQKQKLGLQSVGGGENAVQTEEFHGSRLEEHRRAVAHFSEPLKYDPQSSSGEKGRRGGHVGRSATGLDLTNTGASALMSASVSSVGGKHGVGLRGRKYGGTGEPRAGRSSAALSARGSLDVTSGRQRHSGKTLPPSVATSRRIGVSLGEELDSLGVPRIIHYENLRCAIENRGLVVQLPSNSAGGNGTISTSSAFSPGSSSLYYPSDVGSNGSGGKSLSGRRPSRSLFNLLIAGRGDTRRSRLELPWGDSVKIKYNRTLLGIPDFVVEGLGYGVYGSSLGTHHLIPKVCAVSLEDSLYGVEVLLFYRGLPCNKRVPRKFVGAPATPHQHQQHPHSHPHPHPHPHHHSHHPHQHPSQHAQLSPSSPSPGLLHVNLSEHQRGQEQQAPELLTVATPISSTAVGSNSAPKSTATLPHAKCLTFSNARFTTDDGTRRCLSAVAGQVTGLPAASPASQTPTLHERSASLYPSNDQQSFLGYYPNVQPSIPNTGAEELFSSGHPNGAVSTIRTSPASFDGSGKAFPPHCSWPLFDPQALEFSSFPISEEGSHVEKTGNSETLPVGGGATPQAEGGEDAHSSSRESFCLKPPEERSLSLPSDAFARSPLNPQRVWEETEKQNAGDQKRESDPCGSENAECEDAGGRPGDSPASRFASPRHVLSSCYEGAETKRNSLYQDQKETTPMLFSPSGSTLWPKTDEKHRDSEDLSFSRSLQTSSGWDGRLGWKWDVAAQGGLSQDGLLPLFFGTGLFPRPSESGDDTGITGGLGPESPALRARCLEEEGEPAAEDEDEAFLKSRAWVSVSVPTTMKEDDIKSDQNDHEDRASQKVPRAGIDYHTSCTSIADKLSTSGSQELFYSTPSSFPQQSQDKGDAGLSRPSGQKPQADDSSSGAVLLGDWSGVPMLVLSGSAGAMCGDDSVNRGDNPEARSVVREHLAEKCIVSASARHGPPHSQLPGDWGALVSSPELKASLPIQRVSARPKQAVDPPQKRPTTRTRLMVSCCYHTTQQQQQQQQQQQPPQHQPQQLPPQPSCYPGMLLSGPLGRAPFPSGSAVLGKHGNPVFFGVSRRVGPTRKCKPNRPSEGEGFLLFPDGLMGSTQWAEPLTVDDGSGSWNGQFQYPVMQSQRGGGFMWPALPFTAPMFTAESAAPHPAAPHTAAPQHPALPSPHQHRFSPNDSGASLLRQAPQRFFIINEDTEIAARTSPESDWIHGGGGGTSPPLTRSKLDEDDDSSVTPLWEGGDVASPASCAPVSAGFSPPEMPQSPGLEG